ncbi:hypothetical protein Tco_0829615 [Tanacetum coccineum]
MANVNVNAPAAQSPVMAPPTRTDERILPKDRWVPIEKSNCSLDEGKPRNNPIAQIAVDILKQTNFFNAFTKSSTIPSIYIQQFWVTIHYDTESKGYKVQLDEQWFNLSQDTLRDALQITPIVNNRAFSPPPSPDTLIKFVNDLGYSKTVRTLSDVVTNDMFQPWRALATMINLCLTGKTSGFEITRAPVLQILWAKPLPEVPGKGKAKIGKEQAANVLIDLQSPKKRSTTVRFTFQKRTDHSTHEESSSLYSMLGLTDSETESDDVGEKSEVRGQDKGQAGSNPGDADVSQPSPNHDENLKLPTEGGERLEEPANSVGTLSSLQNLEKIVSFADQFIANKSQEDEPGKTSNEAEVQSMVSVPILQDTSSAPLMTTPIIDLCDYQPASSKAQTSLTYITATTTTHLPLPTQLQVTQSLIQRMGELEHHLAEMSQSNRELEERLTRQNERLSNLEKLSVESRVTKVVEEIITNRVDWAMQAPLLARFRGLPVTDMKMILLHQMSEEGLHETHEVHMKLYEALKESIDRDHSDDLQQDLILYRKKKKTKLAIKLKQEDIKISLRQTLPT